MIKLLDFIVKKRIAFAFLLVGFFLIFSRPTRSSILLGLVVAVAGEVIRTWASGYISKSKVLATQGPYYYVRNPLYLGSFIIGLGVCLMGGNVIFLLIYLLLFTVVYMRLVRKEEEKVARLFGEEYINYKDRVPRFIPRFNKRGKGRGDFDWLRVLQHGEYNAWLGLFSITIFLLFKAK
ncbi:MAG: isoprenylcysteine carboxylmethyltransferase family protein [Deltaproteobacteria bacterium]|nr:MAG: isoprenylcysteine carboxylmethyltransferase family protein [Deltaproteobacteria bacterium]